LAKNIGAGGKRGPSLSDLVGEKWANGKRGFKTGKKREARRTGKNGGVKEKNAQELV